MWLKHREERGEHLTLGWSHLPQSLPSVWTLGLLGKVSVQGDTLTPCPPVLTASRILVLSGNKFQPISALALHTQPAASYTRTPASQPIPQPRSQHPGARVLASQKSSSHQGWQGFRPKPSEEPALADSV